MKDFKQLISTIGQVHNHLQAKAANAVNQALTIRNWLIGFYIVEFEQEGKDRAEYGDRLIDSLASELKHIKGIDRRSLFRFRHFYLTYPQISQTLADPSFSWLIKVDGFINKKQKVGTVSPQLKESLQVPPEKIISRLSYSHLELLLYIDNPLKRTFYEIECIKGTWSVRELKRQINSQYFERSGLSAKPEKLAALVQQKTSPQAPADIIKNMYAFEFLDLKTREVVEESDLESEKNDNPPVGILLVAEKDHALVKYATAGMDENLFVQQYLLQLPSTEQLQRYMEKELKELR